MKRRKVADRGDMVAIPTAEGREVFAQVCWASDYYKDVIQIAFVNSRTEEELRGDLLFIEPTIFCTGLAVRKKWRKLFTHTQLYEPFPPIFYSAGGIHKGDQYIREATEQEYSTLLKLVVKGSLLAQKIAADVANKIDARGVNA